MRLDAGCLLRRLGAVAINQYAAPRVAIKQRNGVFAQTFPAPGVSGRIGKMEVLSLDGETSLPNALHYIRPVGLELKRNAVWHMKGADHGLIVGGGTAAGENQKRQQDSE